MKEREMMTMMMRKSVWREKLHIFFFFFFWLRSGSTLFAHALRRSAEKQPAPVGNFFLWILISSLSVCLLYTPLNHDTFYSYPFFFRLPIFLIPRHTHEKHLIMYEKDLSEQPPPPSLIWFMSCVCVCERERASPTPSFFSLLKNFGRPVICMNVFQFDYEKKKNHSRDTTPPHTNITTTIPDLSSPFFFLLYLLAGDFWIKRGRKIVFERCRVFFKIIFFLWDVLRR